MKKQSASQTSWSLISAGVSSARVEAHRVQVAINQIIEAIKGSKIEDEVYRLCGDAITMLPDATANIERELDKTSYALIKLGDAFYRQRLPHQDRELVDITSQYAPFPSPKKVATQYLKGRVR